MSRSRIESSLNRASLAHPADRTARSPGRRDPPRQQTVASQGGQLSRRGFLQVDPRHRIAKNGSPASTLGAIPSAFACSRRNFIHSSNQVSGVGHGNASSAATFGEFGIAYFGLGSGRNDPRCAERTRRAPDIQALSGGSELPYRTSNPAS